MTEDREIPIVIITGKSSASKKDGGPECSNEREDLTHPWPHLKSFYDPVLEKTVIESDDDRSSWAKGSLKCTSCPIKVRFSTKSTYTLKNHYKNAHPDQLKPLKDAITGGSKRGRRNMAETAEHPKKVPRQSSIPSHFRAFGKKKTEQPFYRKARVSQVLENDSLDFPSTSAEPSSSDSNSSHAEEFENPSNFLSVVIKAESQTQVETMDSSTPLTNTTPTIPKKSYSKKRKFPESIQSTSFPNAIFPEKKIKQEKEGFTVAATYSFYRNMADEALKLSSLNRLKLQVAIMQLHIDAIEKQKSNTNEDNNGKTNENNSKVI